MKNNTMVPKNDEEIQLEDEEEDVSINPCITDAVPLSSQAPVVLRKGARNEAVVTIPNSDDVHVVAAVLGSSLEEGKKTDNVFGGPVVPKNPPVAQEMMDGTTDDDTESSSSSESDIDDAEEILVCDTYNDLKNVIDDMMAQSDAVGGHESSTHQSAAELLFGTDSNIIESLRQALKDVCVQPDDTIVEAGNVVSRLEGTLVIHALPGSELLGEGSILVDKNKNPIGSIEDIIGPVQSPMYVLMDPTMLSEDNVCISPGDTVYSVPSLSKKVLDQEDLRVKGYDADEIEDAEDVPECEFSDDEAEAAYKESLKNQKEMPPPDSGARKKRRPRQRQQQPQRPTTVAEFYASRGSYPTPANNNESSFLPVSFQSHHATS